ncbi:hypothetical protein [Ammoniphilus sp. CFH 90114]|uniref:hypothetical protein n=1 Tax=Ammoniphilus sp. CFH 90114 TaxID=2493665 RepID=UPI00100F7689|nr:hypothetical protein [Ammoniphilus sp. CFH 90114]RXT04860.1 hypothetical protein EIZ39_19240 [Ammoniphilus sp. CFH 90114]
MDKPINVKGVCNKFIGKFREEDWETIAELGKSTKKLQVKKIETKKNKGLVITSSHGVLNLYAQKEGPGTVTGSLFLMGNSVSDIIKQPIWKVFHTAAHSFESNAVINFYPAEGEAIEYRQGLISREPGTVDPKLQAQIDEFLKQHRIDYLLEKLQSALHHRDQFEINWLKQELSYTIGGLAANH